MYAIDFTTTGKPYLLDKNHRNKILCPYCEGGSQKLKTRTLYIDTQTGQPYPAKFGYCDRDSCTEKHLKPTYKEVAEMRNEKLTVKKKYPRKRRTEYLVLNRPYNKTNSYQLPEKKDLSRGGNLYLKPVDYHNFTQKFSEYNRFMKHLMGIVQDRTLIYKMLQLYEVRQVRHHVCFPYIDKGRRVHSVQTIYYDSGGNKDISKPPRWLIYHPDFAKYLADPDFVKKFKAQKPRLKTLFGCQLLNKDLGKKRIVIVEGPKTALVCSMAFPDSEFLFMATASSVIDEEILSDVLKDGREIILMPDTGNAHIDWSLFSIETNHPNLKVSSLCNRLFKDSNKDIADYKDLHELNLRAEILK